MNGCIFFLSISKPIIDIQVKWALPNNSYLKSAEDFWSTLYKLQSTLYKTKF